ncbi:MAG TPA: FAD-dependent oxidoreductase [Gammaproteobacteria bacterium]
MQTAAISINNQFMPERHDVVVIGSGPVGIRVVQELLKRDSSLKIAIFGDEPWKPYNRIKLSSLLTGDVSEQDIYQQQDISQNPSVTEFYNNRIISIDRHTKEVIDSYGRRYGYKKLILATGSKPHLPSIDGIHLKNVFTFRDLSDAQKLMGRTVRTRRTVIVGGGLLGLEAARAMQRFNTHVCVIEHSMWLMFRQLDQRAGAYLKQYIEGLGIEIFVNSRVTRVIGEDQVTSVVLANGREIECDTLIVAAGIVPNIQLAVDAGIHIGRGIRVNDQLQTNDPDVFAVGECVEHRNKVYGLIAPGYEQASVAAHIIKGLKAQYLGSVSATNLKVLDYPVFSMGNTGISARSRENIIYQDHKNERYRKLVVINGRLRGAVAIGNWPDLNLLQEAIAKQRRIWPWDIKRFIKTGQIWKEELAENVIEWPATSIICNCTGVTRGDLEAAEHSGARTAAELAAATGASTVCGSCRPLINNFIGCHSKPEPVTGYRPLLMASLVSVVAALIILMLPGMDYMQSVQGSISWDALWRDSLFKQISGFSTLGMSLLISVISFRKRLNSFVNKWDFDWWRVFHVVVAVIVIAVLLIHTGFRFGDNLNFYLMSVYSGLILVGALAGTAIAVDHVLTRKVARRLRTVALWLHIILLWPMPVLLGFHIAKTYYF